jgi:hypothetical protein
LRALPAGRGGVVAVEAAAGLGKTTLLRHLRTAAQEAGCTVLSACGAELEQEFTFGAVRQLFCPVPAAAGDAGLFTGTATAPVVVLVDDVQWLDLPSSRFLGFLTRRLDSGPG